MVHSVEQFSECFVAHQQCAIAMSLVLLFSIPWQEEDPTKYEAHFAKFIEGDMTADDDPLPEDAMRNHYVGERTR